MDPLFPILWHLSNCMALTSVCVCISHEAVSSRRTGTLFCSPKCNAAPGIWEVVSQQSGMVEEIKELTVGKDEKLGKKDNLGSDFELGVWAGLSMPG